MKLIFFWENGRSLPFLICDVCGDKITDAAKAMLKFGDVETEAILCHKGECDRNSANLLYWHELATVLVWIEHNSAFDRKTAQHHAKMLASL